MTGWKLLLGSIDRSFWQGPVYPNTSSVQNPPQLQCGDPPGCLFNVLRDPHETLDVAAEEPAHVAALRARISELQAGVYNPDRGSADPQLCNAAVGRHGGYIGPWIA